MKLMKPTVQRLINIGTIVMQSGKRQLLKNFGNRTLFDLLQPYVYLESEFNESVLWLYRSIFKLLYSLTNSAPAGCTVKHMLVELDTRGDGTGLVLRGGWNRLPSHIRPLTVMHIRPNSISAW